ncbi:AAA domain-containing protein [Pochonia chlamydosporia 170]|uniref:AAA domain-containing protein n=1 Tax=Pochonia chlamydosporia 170 TaxID=1380566 RepID=A0A179F3B7_METCM|nr:AAA domain-containing protein [Pochonia chlamydosporia 170]OAQ59905.1 AAA domain-containing protein [Pochonia chlamydosporia 170]
MGNLADSGYYIWINGFPGVGKLTVAIELQKRLKGSLLLDNHTLIDVVKLPRDHPEYASERKLARQRAFSQYVYSDGKNAGKLKQVIIATDALSDCDFDRAVAMEHKDAALRGKRPFFPVYLRCSKEENLRRVVDPQRIQNGKKKLVDAGFVEEYFETLEILRWEGEGVEVDNTDLTPVEAAERIITAVEEHARL